MEMVVVMIVAAFGGILAFLTLRGRSLRQLNRPGSAGETGGVQTPAKRGDRDTANDPDGGGDGGGGGGD